MKSAALLLICALLLSPCTSAWTCGKSRQKSLSQKSKLRPKIKTAQSPKSKSEKPSGIWGYTMVKNLPPSPETSLAANLSDYEVIIISAKDRREVKRLRSDKDGRFTVPLSPGKYIIYPHIPKVEAWVAMETAVTVRHGVITEVEAWYDALW